MTYTETLCLKFFLILFVVFINFLSLIWQWNIDMEIELLFQYNFIKTIMIFLISIINLDVLDAAYWYYHFKALVWAFKWFDGETFPFFTLSLWIKNKIKHIRPLLCLDLADIVLVLTWNTYTPNTCSSNHKTSNPS